MWGKSMFRLGKYAKNENGQVGVIFALAALPLIAVTSAGLEYSHLSKERNAALTALDAAVLAAANNNLIADSEKDEFAKTHFLANYSGNIDIELTSSVTPDRVRLVAEGEFDLTFGNIIGIDNLHFSEASAASLKTENTICVLSLSEDADDAISFDSALAFTANRCSVHANSKSSSAISTNALRNTPKATSFCAVGGVSGQFEPHARGECSPIEDPYASVSPAEIGECKSEFLFESIVPEPVEETPSRGEPERTNEAERPPNALDQYSDAINLPAVNPVNFSDLLLDLRDRGFGSSEDGVGYGEVPVSVLQVLHGLTGHDLRELLQAFDSYGEVLDCNANPLPACYGFNNPFLNEANPDRVPTRGMVADVFDASFGQFFDEEEEDVPDIVTDGIVELINGQLFSRNNLDNELVPVSANLTGGNVVLTPGTYCGGLTIDGISVQFRPGDYIFKDGPLTFLNESQAKADRVTFGFTGEGATLNIESGSSLDIRSAITGPRAGLAFMQMIDPSLPGNREQLTGVNRIASGGSITMSGTAYFPEQTLMFLGENTRLGANSPAVGLIADKIEFRGQRGSSVEIGVDHVQAGIPPIQPQADDGVRLVE